MQPELRNRIRRERTEQDLASLKGALQAWIERRREVDRDGRTYVGRHETQLASIETILIGAAEALIDSVAKLKPEQDTGQFYEACRQHDRAAVWLQRLWEYYREKFDQRDDDRLGPLLKAADEVVWSCYRQVVVRAPGVVQGPAPLSFVEPEYSPAAVPSHTLPYALRRDAEVDVLDKYIKTLPVPVLRLPPWCVDSPWWLVSIGHEVGHYVQRGLGLGASFSQGLEAAAAAAGLDGDDQAAWGGWGDEIFADTFSTLMMGPWAVWAIAEVERASPAAMATRKEEYPAPVIRLALMVETARAVGMDVSEAVGDLRLADLAAANPRTARDIKVVEGAVAFALGPLPGELGTLVDLCNLKLDPAAFAPAGKVERWGLFLRDKLSMPPERNLETARQVASGSFCAWAAIARELEQVGDRQAARDKLAEKTTLTLRQSAEPGTRARLLPKGAPPEVGAELARELLGLGGERGV